MNVSAVIVTRGNVDLAPVLDSLPDAWEKIIWRNGTHVGRAEWTEETDWTLRVLGHAGDLAVYGRYAAIQYASSDLIYVQDDDVIVSDPASIVEEWVSNLPNLEVGMYASGGNTPYEGIVANMPQEFRHDGYTDSCLVGFGAAFHRDLPRKAFERIFWGGIGLNATEEDWTAGTPMIRTGDDGQELFRINSIAEFRRTCDVVFTTLTPRVLVDVPKVDREFASDPDRMWKQPAHYGERVRMLELARKVRDA